MVLVTGASGFVGSKVMQICDNVIACPSLQGASEEDVRRIVEESGVHTVIHTAAISDIGACAADPDASYAANVMLPVYLAKASENIKLICFSSDQVYGGAKEEGPYSEDMACPNNVYAAHKLEMEQRVLDINPDAVLLRAEWMYDYYLKKSNFFMNMINAAGTVKASSENFRGITYVKEVAENMESVMRLPGGVYNFGSETSKSMYDVTKEFLDLIGKNVSVEDIPSAHNLWMNCEKAAKHGVRFSNVGEGLRKCALDHGWVLRHFRS